MSAYTDWVQWLYLIEGKGEKTILELGCGAGTIELCKQFKKVYSFETWSTEEWYKKTDKQARKYDNWHGHFKSFNYYGFIDQGYPKTAKQKKAFQKYVKELDDYLSFAGHIDVAFVDPGIYWRGELVNYFISKIIPVIFAHDTNKLPHRYGWPIIIDTPLYDKHIIKKGAGLTVWKLCHESKKSL